MSSALSSEPHGERPLGLSNTGDPQSVFRDATDSFRSNLPTSEEEEFAKYRTADEMLSSIKVLAENHPVHCGRLLKVFKIIKGFSYALEPYFDIVGIFVQVNPEYAAIVWGSLAMIFRLSTNFVTFLEKVSTWLEKLRGVMPPFESWAKALQDRCSKTGYSYPRVGRALANVYADILRFCHRLCLSFSRKRMDIYFKASFIGRLMWKPFEVQFSDLLKELRDNSELLQLELTAATSEEAMKFYTALQERYQYVAATETEREPGEPKIQQDELLESLQEWINAPPWTDSFERAKACRAAGTCEWIFSEPSFQEWQSQACNFEASLAERFLTIQAKPGFGKTILCSTIIERLGENATGERPAVEGLSPFVAYYFFNQQSESNCAGHSLRALASQLLYLRRKDLSVLMSIQSAKRESGSGQKIASDEEIFDILCHYLLLTKDPTVVVMDGLDECSQPEELLRLLQRLKPIQSCAFLLSCRPTVVFPRTVSNDKNSIRPNSDINRRDIERFTRRRVEELYSDGFLPNSDSHDLSMSDSSAEDITTKISARANGMFLWVKLLFEYLRLPTLTLWRRLDAIDNLKSLQGLDKLYAAIVASLETQFQGDNTITNLFCLVATAKRPLHISEMSVALTVPLDRAATAMDAIPRLELSMGAMSGALIETDSEGKVKFIHLSTLEFFESGSKSFCGVSNDYITGACLSYLNFTIPAKPLATSSQVTAQASILRGRYPFLGYCCRYWGQHLLDWFNRFKKNGGLPISKEPITSLLNSFLYDRDKISTWIEASWTFSFAPEICPALTETFSRHHLGTMFPMRSTHRWLVDTLIDLKAIDEDLKSLRDNWAGVLLKEPNEIWEPSVPAFTRSRFWVQTSESKLKSIKDNSDRKAITIQSKLSVSGGEVGIVRLYPSTKWINEEKGSLSQTGMEEDDTWEVTYEIRRTTSHESLYKVAFSASSSRILPFLSTMKKAEVDKEHSELSEVASDEQDPKWLKDPLGPGNAVRVKWKPLNVISFPAAISDDLLRVLLLDTVINIYHAPGLSQGLNSHTFSSLNLNIEHNGEYVAFKGDLRFPSAFEPYFSAKFNPAGKYIALIHESQSKATKQLGEVGDIWCLRIFRDENFGISQKASYACLVVTQFFAFVELGVLLPCRGIAFHPTLPRLAFPQTVDGIPQTYIWDFESPVNVGQSQGNPDSTNSRLGKGLLTYTKRESMDKRGESSSASLSINPFPIHDPPLVDPYFAEDPNYVCGTDAPIEFGIRAEKRAFCSPFIVKVPESHFVASFDSAHSLTIRSGMRSNPLQTQEAIREAVQELSLRPKPQVQHANTFTVDRDGDGVIHVSQLHHLEKQGAIVLRSFDNRGSRSEQTVHRLPDYVAKNTAASLVKSRRSDGVDRTSNGRDDIIRLVLNQPPKKFYESEDVGQVVLPAVIERKAESITSFWNTWHMRRSEFDLEEMRPNRHLLEGTSAEDSLCGQQKR